MKILTKLQALWILFKSQDRLDTEAVHKYFELSYCNYLVMPRSILQSMPDDWQKKFIRLVEECDERTGWRENLGLVEAYKVTPIRIEYTGRYRNGQEIEKEIEAPDKFMDYERGRKQWPLDLPK